MFVNNDPRAAAKYFADKVAFTTVPAEVVSALRDVTLEIVDVRDEDDYATAHIPGSVFLAETEWATGGTLDPEKMHVLVSYSATCRRAAKAAVALAKLGFSVMEMEGGFASWKEQDFPTEAMVVETG